MPAKALNNVLFPVFGLPTKRDARVVSETSCGAPTLGDRCHGGNGFVVDARGKQRGRVGEGLKRSVVALGGHAGATRALALSYLVLANRLYVNTASFAAPNRNAAAVHGTFQRIAQRGRAYKMYQLTGNKAHFTQPRSDAICTRDADDISSLSGLEVGRVWCPSVVSLMRINLSKSMIPD